MGNGYLPIKVKKQDIVVAYKEKDLSISPNRIFIAQVVRIKPNIDSARIEIRGSDYSQIRKYDELPKDLSAFVDKEIKENGGCCLSLDSGESLISYFKNEENEPERVLTFKVNNNDGINSVGLRLLGKDLRFLRYGNLLNSYSFYNQLVEEVAFELMRPSKKPN